MTDGNEVLASVRASPVRRLVGLAVLWFMGALLLWLALMRPPETMGFQAILVGLGLGAFWTGERMRRATALAVELTDAGLRGSNGEVIAPWEQIIGVGRGTFAFKPSNGLVVRLGSPARAQWRPGLWWRWGRWVGIGGVTPGAQARVMADIIAMRLDDTRS